MLALLVACHGGEGDSGATTADAFVAILSPADGDTVCGAPLAVEVDYAGIVLVDPYAEGPEEPGTGHLDVTLNGQDVFMTDVPRFDIPDVADGEWQLKVELSQANHEPIVPYAGDFVFVTVAEGACGG